MRSEEVEGSLVGSGHLAWKHVHVHVGPGAVAMVWTPNVSDPQRRVELDVLDNLAVLVELGLDQPVVEPRWEGPDEVVVLAHVHLGEGGYATIHGVAAGVDVLADLLGRGWSVAAETGRRALGSSRS